MHPRPFKVATDLVEDLEAHGALARQNVGVVVPVDVHEAPLGRDLEGVCSALSDVLAVDDHVGAVLLAVLHLHTTPAQCCGSGLVLCSAPSVPQPVVQSRRRPLLGPSPG